MLIPADYEARRASIEASYQKERAKAENPHPLWRAVASFKGRPFTRVEMVKRLRKLGLKQINVDAGYAHTTVNAALVGMVSRGLLRRVSPPNGAASKPGGTANYYQAAVDIGQRVAKAKRCRDALLAVLEETWCESQFFGLTAHRLRNLPEMERVVLESRMDGVTLEQIGKDMGVTREYVRQVQRKAFERLKDD